MIAIVDCNSFYCSCEKVFRPELEHKPVVVLSNNDGCIISRTDEAKALGIGMAGAYFEAKELIEKNDVTVFSSNYNLYGDMSWRVMETLRIYYGAENVEVYSVDEAFVTLKHIAIEHIANTAHAIKTIVEQWTGIQVSVGVGKTKVLAKIANRFAKKNKKATNCITVLATQKQQIAALKQTPVEDIWGVGYSYAMKLKSFNIHTAYDLSKQKAVWCKAQLGGIMGIRLLQELNGNASVGIKNALVEKKMIATTRMFGQDVKDITSIKEAIATYTSRAAEKLRRQYGAAKTISIFLVTKHQKHTTSFKQTGTISTYTNLPVATSATQELIKPAISMTERLFEEGMIYKKAGVMLSDIVSDKSIQSNLFAPKKSNVHRLLMNTIDNINFSQRNDILKYATCGTTRNWKMQQNFHSPKYTTRWNELCVVH